MTTLKSITTIELSSICNLKCKYCINRLLVKHPARRAGIMGAVVFKSTLDVLEQLCSLGTQQEVNMNGNGEATLDPDLCSRVEATKKVMGDRVVMFCTNGVNMTPELARDLKSAGIDRVDLSIHSPYHARRAAYMLHDAGIGGVIATGAIQSSHNWAGQLEPEHQIDCMLSNPCTPLLEGLGYVQSEGNVTPCCYDYRNLGVFGHVFDKDLLEKEYGQYELCETCHQTEGKS